MEVGLGQARSCRLRFCCTCQSRQLEEEEACLLDERSLGRRCWGHRSRRFNSLVPIYSSPIFNQSVMSGITTPKPPTVPATSFPGLSVFARDAVIRGARAV
jgi:hypothetical protein